MTLNKEMSVAELVSLTASAAPAPGGGAVSALAGAFGAALAGMVASLTLGKKDCEDVRWQMAAVIEKTRRIREELLEDMKRDAEAFDAYMAALAMPKGTEDEKASRGGAMQKALKAAAAVPLAVAARAAEIIPLTELVVREGNKNAVTDGLVGAMLSRAAVRGALLNVRINLNSIADAAYVAEMRSECAKLEAKAAGEEEAVLALAPELF